MKSFRIDREERRRFDRSVAGCFLLVLAVLSGVVFWQPNAKAANPADASFTANPAGDIANCGGNSECFAFTIDTRLTSTGATTNTATSFSIPTSGYVGNDEAHAYSWVVNWGDGNSQTVSGIGGSISAGISHNYAAAGQYQITIRDSTSAEDGWFDAFGFYLNVSGANANSNKYMFKSINTPFTTAMRSPGASYRFAYMFCDAVNGVGIPSALFSNINTSGAVNTSGMFHSTFYNFASNSASAFIPEGLFDSISTNSATTTANMFYQTFYNYASVSGGATIPNGLFELIRLPVATDTSNMFYATFYRYAYGSSAGTIPVDLFSGVNPVVATNAASMFSNTFNSYSRNSTAGTIPAGLFASISTGAATNLSSMFASTFNSYAFISTSGTIPAGLFSSISTGAATNVSSMFNATFGNYARSSTSGTIPAGLFSSINTGAATNIAAMFTGTFTSYAYSSTSGTIPAGLFDSIDTGGLTSLANLFAGTFNNYAYSSLTGTIPAGLFSSLDTSTATNMSNMFSSTFNSYAYGSTLGIIPSNLFASINTGVLSNSTNMFANALTGYATRKASFSAAGAIINTQSFSSPYAVKIGTGGAPNANPTVVAGNVIYPTYNATARTVLAPTGAYSSYVWYSKDGTSCAAVTPTVDCGPQNAGSLTVFPNSNLWVSTVSTEVGNLTFYSLNPPIITAPVNGFVTNDTTQTVSGTGSAGATVTVRDGGNNTVCTAVVAADGSWTCDTIALTAGLQTLKSTQTNTVGNVSGVSNAVNVMIDLTAPSSNVSVNTAIYGVDNPIISFTTYDNVAVSHTDIFYNDVNGDPAIANNVSSPVTLNLDPNEAVHTITVRTYDTAGNYYDNEIAFPPIVTFTVPTPISNTTIDDATVTVSTPSGNDLSSVVLDSGAAAASLTNCVGAGGDVAAPYAQPVTCQIQNVDVSATVKVTAVDAVNDAVGYNSASFIIDTVSPVITASIPTLESNSAITDTVITVTDNVGIDAGDVVLTAVSTSGSFGIDTYDCVQTYVSVVTCTLSTTGATGAGNIAVSAVDVAGNAAGETFTGFVIDSTPPDRPEVNPTDGATVSGVAEPGSVITITYTDEFGVEHTITTNADSGGAWSVALDPVAGPGSIIAVTATDSFGNVSDVATVIVPNSNNGGGEVTPPLTPHAPATGFGGGRLALIIYSAVGFCLVVLAVLAGRKITARILTKRYNMGRVRND